jgi:cytochrome P450
MTRLTLRIVGATLLGAEFETEMREIGHAVNQGLTWARENTYRIIRWPAWIPTAHNRRFREAIEGIDRVVLRIIDDRRRQGPGAKDLLSILMAARDVETGEAMSDRQIRDEVATIFVAGHETTSNALTWTLYLLSKHPESARRLVAEAAFLGGRAPGVDELPKLAYLKMVLEEALRLYPPAWVIPRRAEADDEIGGFRMEKGWYAFASPYVTHRFAELWPNPEGFDPERFSPEQVSVRPRGAWFPFGIGSRHCIGGSFAMMEAQIALATLLPRFRLDLIPGARVEPRPQVTLRPGGKVPMTLVPRSIPRPL